MRRRRAALRILGPALVAMASAPLAASVGRAQSVSDPTLVLETVATGIHTPTTMAFVAPDDFLVLEKTTGRVRRVLGGVLQPLPVLVFDVDGVGERGLLGIAVNTESPPAVFIYVTEDLAGGPANRVYRYTWNAGAGTLEDPVTILDLPAGPSANHQGGALALGPPGLFPGVGDGALLYAVIGDVGRSGQLQNFEGAAPPDDTGVIFRVLQDGSAAPGSPFPATCSVSTGTSCSTNAECPSGEVCLGRYLAYGVRNAFGLAVDPATGQLWDTENGPLLFDEINRVEPGLNSGWQDVMGPAGPGDLDDLFALPGSSYSDPEFSWEDTVAPTAIAFPADGSLGPAYAGRALVADANNGRIYALPLDAAREGFDLAGYAGLGDLVANPLPGGDESEALVIADGFGLLTDLEPGPDGHLYVVDLAAGIYRLRAAPPAVPGLGAAGVWLLAAALAAAGLAALRRAA